jgi:hypothetical protein
MSAMTIFYQECPICGRSLRIPAKYFGRLMSCTHCQGEFRAGDSARNCEERPQEPRSCGADVAAVGDLLRPGVFATQLGEV